MKVNFTYTSVLSTVIFSTIIFIGLFFYILKKKSAYLSKEVNLIILCLMLIGVKLFIPIEITKATLTVPIIAIYPDICRILRCDFVNHVPLYKVFLMISLCGSILIGVRKIYTYRKLLRVIQYGRRVDIINIKRMFWFKKIPIIELDYIREPFIIGILKPAIILPSDFKENGNLIIKHEINHYINYDLWLKWLWEMLCILYWWNPLIYIGKYFLGNMLEIRNDLSVIKKTTDEERVIYAELLVSFAKKNRKTDFTAGFSNCFLKARTVTILSSKSKTKENKGLIVLIIFAILSTFVIFEPKENVEFCSNQFGEEGIRSQISYLKKSTEGYELYINNKLIGKLEKIPKELEHLKVLPDV